MFIHTADWHIGATPSIVDNYDRQIQAIETCLNLGIRLNVSAILVSGDVFEDYEPSQYDKDVFMDILLKYDSKITFPVIVLEGNHSTSADYSNLETFAKMERYGKLKRFKFAITPRYIELPDMVVTAVPNGFDFNKIPKQHRKKALKTGKPWVVMLHELLHGSVLESGITKKRTKKYKLVGVKGVTYYACGDVHKAGKIAGKANAWYSGSPIQHDFGEHLPKGVLLVDERTGKPKLITKPFHKIKQLVTVTDLREAPDPAKAWVKYKRERPDENEELPDHVVSIEDVKVEQEVTSDKSAAEAEIESIDRREELFAFLKTVKNYSEDDLRLAEELVGDLLQ